MFHTPSQQQDASADKRENTIHHDRRAAGYADDTLSPQIPFPCTLYSWKYGVIGQNVLVVNPKNKQEMNRIYVILTTQ